MSIYKGNSNKKEIEINDSLLKYSTPYFNFYQDQVIFPNMVHGEYSRIEPVQWGGVAILPIDSRGNIILVKSFRHAVRAISIEAPRGFIDANETPEEAARRELLEETGATSEGQMEYVGLLAPENSIINSYAHLFIAPNVSIASSETENDEAIQQLLIVSPSSLKELVRENEITDSFTLGLIFKALVLWYIELRDT
jgi:ADP-ribose pyrophosphatase